MVTRSSRLRSQLGLRLTTSALGAPLVLVGSLLGCTTQAPPPSTPQARTPTPGTVTRNNPAGDAESPVDAALTRLIEEPIGEKADRFRTYRPLFPDANNWKRVRFWGYPSRAGFRYGKDNYAVSVLIYEEADNDDPNACLTAFAKRALNTARLFDVKLGDIERLERPHLRGIEAVDMDALIADELRVFEQRQARRKQGRERLVAMLERGKRAEAARKKAEETREAAKADESTVETEKKKAKPPTRRRRFGLSWLRDRLRHHDVQTEAMEKRKDDKHPVDHATTARAIKARGLSTMPVLLTSGGFETLSNRDRYLAAIVAHPSWPGSCLVQGIAVKVGTDEALAKKALDRWLEKAAPKSSWRWQLREQPTYDTR